MTLDLAFVGWREPIGDEVAQIVARELADAHYPRQTAGSNQYAPPGRRWALIRNDAAGRALWVVCENYLHKIRRFRCTVFRNESPNLSSELIRAATAATYARWARKGWLADAPPLTTEVNPLEVRHKRDPGRCFRKAGWTKIATTNGADKGRADLPRAAALNTGAGPIPPTCRTSPARYG